MAHLSEHGIRLSSMSPSFLNSNSTSHTWPFSAVAELIDNASDPGVTAKQIWIDVIKEEGHLCLTFTDNGSGMTPNKLHKMLSFGFTEKGSGKAGHQAIGVYGNGFKSGSMRLGRDALIFTKNGGCQSLGMLSQTYLQSIKARAVIVPIVPFNQQTKSLVVTEDSEASLEAILRHSLLSSLEQLHAHFDSIPTKKGTKILIWNIRRTKDGNPELDFETDIHDIRMPEVQIEELKKGRRSSGPQRAEQNIPDMDCSLRAYLSILYLKPRTQIILRGKKVPTKLVAKSLSHIENDVYKPQFSKERVKVTFGLNLKSKDHYGVMMYHKNRLIRAYEKVGGQIKTSGQRAGVGVIGVVECNFLKPAHNKQDFEYTKEYRLTLGALGMKLNDYWRAMVEKKAREREFQALERMDEEESEEESPRWLQCEECLKWRCVPYGHYTVTPENWNCSQNPNPRFRNCSSPEEAEESEELTPSYQKTHKKQQQAKSRKREKSLEDKQTSESVPISPSSQPSPQPSHTPDPALTEDTGTQGCQTPSDDLSADQSDSAAENNVHTQDTPAVEVTHTQERHAEGDTPTQDRTHGRREKRTRGQTNTEHVPHTEADADRGKEKEVNMDTVESNKRKTVWPPSRLEKRSRLRDQQPISENTTEDLHPGKDGSETQVLSGEKNKPESTSRVERPMATAQHGSGLAWTHSLPSTQTVVVSPLSHTEGARNRPLPLEGGDREVMMQRLAGLEKEVQRLRKLLGLEVITETQGTMTMTNPSALMMTMTNPSVEKMAMTNPSAEKMTDGVETPMGSTATKSDSWQTEWESSSSPSVQGQAASSCVEAAQDQRAVSGQKEPAEQARTRAQSRLRQRDNDASLPSDGGMVEDYLHCIRSNVVALLAAILPHLDLAGISLEGTDVDSILQQIIDANSLAL